MPRQVQSDSGVTGQDWSPASTTVAVTATVFCLIFLWLYFFVTGQPPAV